MRIVKDRNVISESVEPTIAFVLRKDPELLEIQRLDLWFFSSVVMSPPMMFEHLAGTGLSKFFDLCSLETVESNDKTPLVIGPLRYIHGRSEVMRGSSSITSVLLCRPVFDNEISDSVWFTYLPTIWKKALINLDTSKTA